GLAGWCFGVRRGMGALDALSMGLGRVKKYPARRSLAALQIRRRHRGFAGRPRVRAAILTPPRCATTPRGDTPMTKPAPEPVNPAQLVDLALAVVRADRFPQLAPSDGDQPRVRPVSPVRTDGLTVYVAKLRGYHKTAQIAANPP